MEARYEGLAGNAGHRTELYVVRRRLRIGIDEWERLPWWQRRVYIEGLQDEAGQGPPADGAGVPDAADAILTGTLGDVQAALNG